MVELKTSMKEIAVLMKLQADENNILEFVPIDVIEGNYLLEASIFIGKNGSTYMHMADVLLFEDLIGYVNTTFYALRKNWVEVQNEMPDLSLSQIKEQLLKESLKYKYYLAYSKEIELFDIFECDINTNEVNLFRDEEATTVAELRKGVNKFEVDYGLGVGLEMEESVPEVVDKEEVESYKFNPRELAGYIKNNVFGQDKAIDKIVQAIWCNYYLMAEDNVDYNKENILVVGSSGVGKTEIFRCIQEFNKNIVVHIADLTSVTQTGYYGENLTNLLESLLMKCVEVKNGRQVLNMEKVHHAILVLDEFDKIAIRGGYGSDVTNRPVQEELLKIMEGKELNISLKLNGVAQNVVINTKNITFCCCGAFEGIVKDSGKQIGFGRDISKGGLTKAYSELTKEDFIKYGFIRELLGRMPVIVGLDDLSLELLVKIVRDSKKSLFVKKLKLLKSLVKEVEITEDLYEEIAKIALSKRVGARGIDDASVDLFFPILDEVSNLEEVYQYARMDKDTVRDPKRYILKKGND